MPGQCLRRRHPTLGGREARADTRVDRLDRHPGARGDRRAAMGSRSPASRPGRAGSRCSSRRASTACPRSPSPTRMPPSGPRDAWGGQVLAGEEGIRELIDKSEPDLVLNAIVGAAGLGPTIVALTEGIDLALANKESAGDRRRAGHGARRGDRRPDHPGRLRALGALPADPRGAAGNGRAAGADRLRRALPRPHRPLRGHARGGARPPHLGDGRPDHDRLGDPDEQGLRDDRGAPPLRRPLRADRRRRPPAVDRPLAGPPQRRRLARAPRLPGHAGADLLRAAPPRARRRRRSRPSTWRASASSPSSARHRDLRLPAARARGRRGGGDGALRPQRRRRGRRRGLPRRADRRSPASPR